MSAAHWTSEPRVSVPKLLRMINDRFFCSIVLLICLVSCCNSTSAQLFGKRNIGRNRNTDTADSPAAITGAERFVRGNRTSGDFVGTTNTENTTFVGTAQATGAVKRSVTGLVETAAPSVNVPRIRSPSGIYAERLRIAFEPIANSGYRLPPKTKLSESTRTITEHRGLEVQLSLTDSAVTLRGTVQSPEQKRLAELLVLFEPGIETVTNALNVAPNASH